MLFASRCIAKVILRFFYLKIMKYITSKSPFSHEKSIYNLLNYSSIMLFASRCIAKTIKFKKIFIYPKVSEHHLGSKQWYENLVHRW